MFKLVLEKAEEPEINIHWIIKKAREFQKNIYFCFIDYAKAFDCVDHNKLHKILEEIASLSHSIVFLYFFGLITEEGFLISPCYSLELCIQMGVSFLFSFAFHFSSECSNYHTIAFVSHASKVMLKILQATLQQYVNCELADVQAGFRKGRGTRDQHPLDHQKSKRVPEKYLLLLY